jgi:hypothetical protein
LVGQDYGANDMHDPVAALDEVYDRST